MDPQRRDRRGGILGLAGLLTEHGEAVEADLARFYRVDLRDLWRGRLTWRRLNVLVRGLPSDSATVRAMSGPDAQWRLGEHLLARLVDEAAFANWWAVNAYLKPSQRAKPPEPLPRPGVERARKRPAMSDAARARIEALAPRRDRDG